jgi:acyl-coenzyme A synthetase/AMP-(fatty) acid ligase
MTSSDCDSYPGTLPLTTLTENIKDGDLATMMRQRQASIDGEMLRFHSCTCTSGSTGNPKVVAIGDG